MNCTNTKNTLFPILIGFLLLFGCTQTNKNTSTQNKTIGKIGLSFPHLLIGILCTLLSCENPKDKEVEENISFQLKEYHIIPKVKYSANIILDRKLSKTELKNLAYYIYRNKDIDEYQNTFLTYYLPNMKIGSGGWATTHFNPKLEIEIYGLSIEEEKYLLDNRLVLSSNQKLLGEWLNEEWGYLLSIYTQGNKVFGRYHYSDGSKETNTLNRKKDLIFDKKKYTHGEYYKLSSNNRLSIYDKKGHIYSFQYLQ